VQGVGFTGGPEEARHGGNSRSPYPAGTRRSPGEQRPVVRGPCQGTWAQDDSRILAEHGDRERRIRHARVVWSSLTFDQTRGGLLKVCGFESQIGQYRAVVCMAPESGRPTHLIRSCMRALPEADLGQIHFLGQLPKRSARTALHHFAAV
jgi:hypothetical protein